MTYGFCLQHEELERKRKYMTLAHTYGSAMPMNMELEKSFIGHSLRLPGLQSTKLGMEVLEHKDLDFGFQNYLNPVEFSESQINLHSAMESKLKINLKMPSF